MLEKFRANVLKQNNSDLVFQTCTICLKWESTSWSRDQNLIFNIMNYRFLTQILHLNFKENVEKMIW